MKSLVSDCCVQLEQVTPWQWSSCDGDNARRSRLLDSTHKHPPLILILHTGSANAENPGQVDTPMCNGTTVVGTKCKHRALPGSLYCKKHRTNAETIHVSSLPQSTMKRKHEENYTGSENMFCKDIVLVNGEGSLQVDPVPYIAGNSLHGVNNLSEKSVHSETGMLQWRLQSA